MAFRRVSPLSNPLLDRYGLLTNPRSPNKLVTSSDLDSLIAFRLRLRLWDSDRWIVDRFIGLLRPFLNSPPDLLASSHSVTLSSSLVLSRLPVATPGPSLNSLTAPSPLSVLLSSLGPAPIVLISTTSISAGSFLHQPPVHSPHRLRRGRDGRFGEIPHRSCRRRHWLDLCCHEGYLSSQRGLQRPGQPAAGHFLQPDDLRAAALTSLAPYAIRLCPQ